MLTKYGTDNIIIMLSVGVIMALMPVAFNAKIFQYLISPLGIIFIIFTFIFFRDPDRTIPNEASNPETIISPADGKVVEIVEEIENDFFQAEVKRISIFLSPLNVHVNRNPANGIVKFLEYKKGRFYPAYVPKSSELNEQSKIGVENEAGKIFYKQITGTLARRIVYDCKLGDTLEAGKRFGMMKFSSRMDISIAPNSEILIKEGDNVVAGETIIAKLKNEN